MDVYIVASGKNIVESKLNSCSRFPTYNGRSEEGDPASLTSQTRLIFAEIPSPADAMLLAISTR